MKDKPHYFNTDLPKIPEGEPEVFFHHPELDLKCNQIGILYWGDSYGEESFSPLTEKFTVALVGGKSKTYPRHKLITECYLGELVKRAPRSVLNGITTDLRPENVLVLPHQLPEAIKNTNTFIHRSVMYMLERDHYIESKGIKPQVYWAEFKLPNYITTKYTEVTGLPIIKTKDGDFKFASNKKNTELAQAKKTYKTKEEIKKLCQEITDYIDNQGLSQGKVADKLGMSRTLVSYYYHKNK